MDPEESKGRNIIAVRTYFVRGRNALLARARFGPLFEDYLLHLLQHGIAHDAREDRMVQDLLAAFCLHLASRPWRETSAWTINFQNPLLNLFATGDSLSGRVAGRVFNEDIRENTSSLFFAQVREPPGNPRTSSVEIPDPTGSDPVLRAVEAYYRRSEQRPARYFRLDPEDIVMVSAQPDCDHPWFDALDTDSMRSLDQTEPLALLEKRRYFFGCGCSLDKLLPILNAMSPASREGLFAENIPAVITCPRCAAVFLITPEQIDGADTG